MVPQADNRLGRIFVLKAEHTYACGPAEEKPTGGRRPSQPARRDHADDVTAGKGEHVAVVLAHTTNEAIRAASDVLRRFTVGTPVAEEFPSGPLAEDVFGKLPLEAAVVPLHQVGVGFRRV